ncbi:hypothetical protein CCP4SC76_3690013 [Gammaproteobacteria bacterium]
MRGIVTHSSLVILSRLRFPKLAVAGQFPHLALIIVSMISSCPPTGRNEMAQGNALGLTGYRTLPGAWPRALMMPLRAAK